MTRWRSYDVNPIRIQLPAALDDGKRYDFAILLPQAEDHASIYARIRQGIQDHFRVTIGREARMLDAYVVTSPDAKPPAAKPKEDDGTLGFAESYSVEFESAHAPGEAPELPKSVSLAAVRGISLVGTVDKFCRALEGAVDRPVVNESNLEGEFEFDVKAPPDGENDFLERLHRQLGIVIKPAQKSVEIIAVKAR